MKKYKVNGKIIDAKTELEAIKKYNDSIKDSRYVILHPNKYEFLSYGAKSWVSEDSDMIIHFNSAEEATDFGRKWLKQQFRVAIVDNAIKDSITESEEEVVEDAIYWVKKSGKELTINNILKQIDEDMKGFLGGNQSRIIAYLKNEKHIKDSVKDIDYNLENQIAKEKWTGKTIDEISSLLKKYGFNKKINEYNLSDNIRKISLKNSNEDIITLKYDIRYNKIKEAELNYKVLDSVKDNNYKFTLNKKKNDYDEYVIKAYRNGNFDEASTYYTDDWEDAVGTIKAMASRQGLTVKQSGNSYIADSVKDDLKYKVGSKLEVDYDAKNLQKWHGYEDWVIEDILNKEDKIYIISHGNLKQSISERDIDKMMSIKDSVKDSKQYIQKGLIEFVVNDTHKAYTFGSARGYNESYDKKGLEQHLKLTEESLDYVNNLERQGFKQDKDKAYLKDANIDILNKLIVEEEKAINDYKSAIENDPDEYASSVYKHILNEEIEHLEELKNLINGKTEDSVKDSFEPFFFKDDPDYWEDESEYVGNNLKPEKYMDEYNDYEEFINMEFTAKILGAPGNYRENSEMKRYFEEKWPSKAALAKRIFK